MRIEKLSFLSLALLVLSGCVATKTPSEDTYSRYAVIVTDAPVTWAEARGMAQDLSGHLATITSAEEHQAVWELVSRDSRYWSVNSAGFHLGPWLGAYQLPGSVEPGGGWQWVTGEPMSYSGWIRPDQPGGTQPNDTRGVEDALVFMGVGQMAPGWNDYPSAPSGQGWQAGISAYVLEREGNPDG